MPAMTTCSASQTTKTATPSSVCTRHSQPTRVSGHAIPHHVSLQSHSSLTPHKSTDRSHIPVPVGWLCSILTHAAATTTMPLTHDACSCLQHSRRHTATLCRLMAKAQQATGHTKAPTEPVQHSLEGFQQQCSTCCSVPTPTTPTHMEQVPGGASQLHQTASLPPSLPLAFKYQPAAPPGLPAIQPPCTTQPEANHPCVQLHAVHLGHQQLHCWSAAAGPRSKRSNE